MGAIQVEIKVLKGTTPLLFSWENPVKREVESFLVTCSCQKLGLNHNDGKGAQNTALTSGSQEWAAKLAQALEKAEVITYAGLDPLESVANHIDVTSREEKHLTYSKEEWKKLSKKEKDRIRRRMKREKKERDKKKEVEETSEGGPAAVEVSDDETASQEPDDTMLEDALMVKAEKGETVLSEEEMPDQQIERNQSEENVSSFETSANVTEASVLTEKVNEPVEYTCRLDYEPSIDENLRDSQDDPDDVTIPTDMTSNELSVVPSDKAMKTGIGSEITVASEATEGPVRLVDIDATVVVTSSTFSNSVPSTLSDEQTLMRAIDSIIDMCPDTSMSESPEIPGAMYALPPESSTELPRTRVPFIRNLTEEERKMMFKFKSDMDEKNQSALASGKGVLCEHCGKVLAQRNLKKHVKTHEKGRKKNLFCDICGKGFYFSNGLKNHLKIHDNKAQYTCRYCPKSYKSFFGRTIHERLHFGVFPETCLNCNRKFNSNRQLKNHVCEGAGKAKRKTRSDSGWSRRSLVPLEPGTKGSATCTICNKVLRVGSFTAHMNTHEGKMFTCPICGKVMAFGTRYYHMKWHQNTKDFKCDTCGKDFRTKQALEAHTRVHTGERPIKCRYCDRRFSRYSSREVHEAVHTGERAFKCTICDKSWKDRSSYWLHMKKNHPGEPLFYRRRSAQINSRRQREMADLQAE